MENSFVETEKKSMKPSSPYMMFFFKSVTLAIIVYFLIMLMIDSAVVSVTTVIEENPQLVEKTVTSGRQVLRKILGEDLTRLRRIITANPTLYSQAADSYEKNGDFANAAQEIELAIGLLELHSSEKIVKEKYLKRLGELRSKARLATAGQSDTGKK